MAKSSKIDKFNHLLGCIPDKDVAKACGLKTPAAVQSRRKQLNKTSYRQNCKKIREADAGWKRKKDDEAAKDIGVPELLLSVFRYIDALQKDKKETTEKYKLEPLIVAAVLETLGTSTKTKSKTTKRKVVSKRKTKSTPVKRTKKPTRTKKTITRKSKVKAKPVTKSKPKTSTRKKVTKKVTKPETKISLSRLYQCVFAEGDTTNSVYVVADSFQEASKKVEEVQGKLFSSSSLKSIQNIGQAIP